MHDANPRSAAIDNLRGYLDKWGDAYTWVRGSAIWLRDPSHGWCLRAGEIIFGWSEQGEHSRALEVSTSHVYAKRLQFPIQANLKEQLLDALQEDVTSLFLLRHRTAATIANTAPHFDKSNTGMCEGDLDVDLTHGSQHLAERVFAKTDQSYESVEPARKRRGQMTYYRPLSITLNDRYGSSGQLSLNLLNTEVASAAEPFWDIENLAHKLQLNPRIDQSTTSSHIRFRVEVPAYLEKNSYDDRGTFLKIRAASRMIPATRQDGTVVAP